ncbi:ClpXP protease specificity-enhancing factor SspB [Acetobacteraceae bacterium KSS8]|uniref:ClpXP protease specificity-enhancing factor SspB n=1 Tax=Endosaccharibacter trunci TaxID=2812733 RepID=A0ABT1W5G7_9PROT|nr:ClpXP protease specificity-enhancing factor SspB [Acetobacteraceae bacterium KSS8]
MAEDDSGGIADENDGVMADSLLPYDRWIEQAYRQVMIRALNHAAAEGLPGAHHFYLTFRTDDPLTVVPKRMLAQYPTEMTIVLQHQFWDLKVDEEAELLTVGLSFGSVPTTLAVPLRAITGFADPQVRLALRFTPETHDTAQDTAPASADEAVAVQEPEEDGEKPDPTPQVVSLDAFRKRSNPS